MSELWIVALGPDRAPLMTDEVKALLEGEAQVLLRTRRHGAADWLENRGIPFEDLDELYDRTEDFDELCEAVTDRIRTLLRQRGELVYAAADPVRDETVLRLCRQMEGEASVHVLPGISQADVCAAAVVPFGVDCSALKVVTASSLKDPHVAADCPLCVVELDNVYLASDVKLLLGELFDDEMTVYFLPDASVPRALPICLHALDRQEGIDHRSAVLVPEADVFHRRRADFADLVEVIRRLRAPGGCPWDRKQTHQSLRRYMIEEAYEAADAMEAGDPERLADELGDVLLQVVLGSQVAADHRDFTWREVTTKITRKMIRRHAHVFGETPGSTDEEIRGIWERKKQEETSRTDPLSRARSVPGSMPALIRGQKVLSRLYGQDIGKETGLQETLREQVTDEGSLGTVLEQLCARAEELGLDAEQALHSALGKRL